MIKISKENEIKNSTNYPSYIFLIRDLNNFLFANIYNLKKKLNIKINNNTNTMNV